MLTSIFESTLFCQKILTPFFRFLFLNSFFDKIWAYEIVCRPSGGKSLSLLDYWILKFNSMERAKGSKWPTAVGPEPDTSSEKEKNARMSPERTKRTKKKLGRSSVRLGLWQARLLCSCLGLLWGLSTFFVTSLEDNHQRRQETLFSWKQRKRGGKE